MSEQTPVSKQTYSLLPTDIEGVDSLAELALDMRWSWNHATDEVWRQLDSTLWEFTQNPWVVLQTVSRDKLQRVLADPAFRKRVDDLIHVKRHAAETPAWFQQNHPQSPLTRVAYFSMEFMLSEALPIHSGGLGNVAGDQLKAASDLGVPVVGVGLLYQQGYFRQVIDKDGAQQALFPHNDPGQLPIMPLREPNGEWLRLEIALPGYSVWLRAWQVHVGRVRLYLLDSNDAANFPAHRGITSELYGGGPELRLNQEMVLGIGGWRLLDALGLKPEVCHLNEGHAAFAVLERARTFMEETGQSFEVALAATRSGNLFTTHTPVAAGFDRFSPALIEQYLGGYARKLGISLHDLLALGRANPNDSSEPFNMAYLAVRGSGSEGHRFNFNRVLLDPFASAISPLPDWDFGPARGYDPSAPERDLVCSKVDDAGAMPKCVFTHEYFHWHDDRPPRHPWSKTVIYETHVRGFTIHPNSDVEHPGTYRGLTEKIPYLEELGVTAVELMPVLEFNETSVTRRNPHTSQPLRNYWGYDPVAFFAPKASYSSSGGLGQQKLEFKEMVLAFHNAGIEVILDVVFNHTAEGNELGPTLCFRGMDNAIFYTLADQQIGGE
jgi:hypothetical protein